MRIGSLAEVLGPTLFRGMSYNDAIALLNVLTAFCDSVFLPKGQLRPRTIERLRLRVRRYSSMAPSVAASDTEQPYARGCGLSWLVDVGCCRRWWIVGSAFAERQEKHQMNQHAIMPLIRAPPPPFSPL